ncbi:MAG: tyrosine-type recombinase/integrase [Alphaproteobacteria bacterium]|nr:tyrosine-type recombinase/integrase [Alphaproteobacteria bacterium]
MTKTYDYSRRSIPLLEWPAKDRETWEKAVTTGDFFDENGHAYRWRPRTKQTNAQQYGRWLGYLAWRGCLNPEDSPASRVTPEMVKEYGLHLKNLVAPRTRLSMLVGLKVTIQAMCPEKNWRWLQDMCNRVQRVAKPQRYKLGRMQPTEDIYTAAIKELRSLSSEITDLEEAIEYRDALMLALLAARPMRVRNFTSITLGKHLKQVENGWLISFTADETKTHQPIEFLVPDDLRGWFGHYLKKIRPLFPEAEISGRLWLNQYGARLGNGFVHSRITRLTKKLFGKPINPHMLRDCAASSLAMVSADLARMAAPLLGHRYFSTTERYYIQANNLEASRLLNDILAVVKKHTLQGEDYADR